MLPMALFSVSPLWAQRSYSCDFEIDSISSRWVLNPGSSDMLAQAKNLWYIGEPGNNGGNKGLYISNDGGATATYTAVNNCMVAYTTLTLEPSMVDYCLTFDYRAMGNYSSTQDGLYACWIPELDDDDQPIDLVSVMNSNLKRSFQSYLLDLPDRDNGTYQLVGVSNWRQCKCYIPKAWCNGKPHRLAFFWINTTATPAQPAACIDNIYIYDARSCDEPKNIRISTQGTQTIMTWSGTAPAYEVSAYDYENRRWYGPSIATDTTYTFNDIVPGYVDFYVRSRCEADLYSMKIQASQLVYYPDEMCVDYLDLNKARCYTNSGPVGYTSTFSSFTRSNPVDYGPYNSSSRHTVHYAHEDYDARTGGLLKAVPTGELASVRLGNWLGGSEAERLEYTMTVDSLNYPVMLLKYAIVIEAPGHGPSMDPRFKLEVMEGTKSLGSCTNADFNANDVFSSTLGMLTTKDSSWHITTSDVAAQGGATADVVWRDWTTVGINLSAYHGKKMTVRLTTLDCGQGGHFGYAYFTLGCTDGKLKGLKCGEVNPDFEAPDGFIYRWMLRSNESKRRFDGSVAEQYILGRDQRFEALRGSDGIVLDSVYAVDCMFASDTTCYFTLYASPLANNPVARMDPYKITPDCRNEAYYVNFNSTSYVEEVDHITNDTALSTRRLDGVEWDFGDGQKSYESNPTHLYSSNGGEYDGTLTAHLANCTSVIPFHVSLPAMGPLHDTLTVAKCDGESYMWHGRSLTEYGYYSDTVVTDADCDSIYTLHLVEPIRDTVEISILDDETFWFYGHGYTAKDTIAPQVYTSPDCDSIITLILHAHTILRATVPSEVIVCADQSAFEIPYEILTGRARVYSLAFRFGFNNVERDSLYDYPRGVFRVDMPIDIEPNVYPGQVVFYDSISGDVILPIDVHVNYAASILVQRWNDVIGIKNAENNGGYEFVDFQWYRNGEPIMGETGPYLYAQGGLDMSSDYSVEVTRVNDGVRLAVCPVSPDNLPVSDMPTLVQRSVEFVTGISGDVCWINTGGRIVMTAYAEAGSTLTAPDTPGLYLMVVTEDGHSRVFHIVVK